jgi:hypothetical protein
LVALIEYGESDPGDRSIFVRSCLAAAASNGITSDACSTARTINDGRRPS